MKKQLMTVMLVLVALSAAQAKIGQTPQEVIQDARREKAVSVQWVDYLGKQLLQVTYHDDIVCHLFGADGREIAFYYVATKGLKPEDVEKLKAQVPHYMARHGNRRQAFQLGIDKWSFDGSRALPRI